MKTTSRVVCGLLLASGHTIVAADDFHVDAVVGSDVPGGGTSVAPWRTISYALGQVSGEGHTIHVAAGTYDAVLGESFPIRMEPRVSVVGAGIGSTKLVGASDAPLVTFVAGLTGPLGRDEVDFGPDTRLTDMSLAMATTAVGLTDTGSAECSPALERLEIVGMVVDGIDVSTGIGKAEPTIAGCTLLHCDVGIDFRGLFDLSSNSRVVDCHIDDCRMGIDLSGDAPSPFETRIVDIERCRLTNCEVGLHASTVDSGVIARLFDTLIAGCDIGVEGIGSLGTAIVELTRCTVTANGHGLRGSGFAQFFFVENSIVWGNARNLTGTFLPQTFFIVEWSDVDSGGILVAANNVNVDPQFVIGSPDFSLSSDSPLIDAGDPAHSTGGVDFQGDPRLVDGSGDLVARVDMGWDEFNPVHLDISGTPAPGQSLTLDLFAPAGWSYFDLVSVQKDDVPLGGLGSLLCSPVGLFVVASGAAPGSDLLPLPPNPNLSGLELCFQSVGADFGTGAGSFSNRIGVPIE